MGHEVEVFYGFGTAKIDNIYYVRQDRDNRTVKENLSKHESKEPVHPLVEPTDGIVQMIQKEIDYHKEHKGESGYVSAWENGFLKGLRHIQEILEKK